MYCIKCGIRNTEDAHFCINCGFEFDKESNTGTENVVGSHILTETVPTVRHKKKNNQTIGFVATAIAFTLLISAIALLVFLGKGKYRQIVEAYLDSFIIGDAYSVADLIPEHFKNNVWDLLGYDDINEAVSYWNGELRRNRDSLFEDFDIDSAISYEIENAEKYTNKEFESISDLYEEFGVSIEDAKKIEATITATSNERTLSRSLDISLVKCDGQWYLDTTNTEGCVFNMVPEEDNAGFDSGYPTADLLAIIYVSQTDAAVIADMVPAVYNEKLWNAIGYVGKDDVVERISQTFSFEQQENNATFGNEWYFTAEIANSVTYDNDKMQRIISFYNNYGIEVVDAQIIFVNKTTYSNTNSKTETVELPVIKISDSWWLDLSGAGY